jgi:hypothetical protein
MCIGKKEEDLDLDYAFWVTEVKKGRREYVPYVSYDEISTQPPTPDLAFCLVEWPKRRHLSLTYFISTSALLADDAASPVPNICISSNFIPGR